MGGIGIQLSGASSQQEESAGDMEISIEDVGLNRCWPFTAKGARYFGGANNGINRAGKNAERHPT